MLHTHRLHLYHGLASRLPQSRCFSIKRAFLRFAGATVGRNVRISSTARFLLQGKLEIGENTWIGEQALLIGGAAQIVIGRDVDIGPRVTLVTGTHSILLGGVKAAGDGYSLPIKVGNGVWIGACVTVLGSVDIGDCSIVGASSLVNRSIPARTLAAGVPVRVIRKLSFQDEVQFDSG